MYLPTLPSDFYATGFHKSRKPTENAPVHTASIYSYDIHGNVKSLLQYNADLQAIGHHYKRLDYQYDLISGKVKLLDYQNAQPDQFHHHYEYDSENLLVQVFTSSDSVIWQQDARYFVFQAVGKA